MSAAPSSVTNAAELTAALLNGGAIRLMPGRYVGNFVIGVDGTTLVGRATLPDARVQPSDVAGVVLAPADPQAPALRVTASRMTVSGLRSSTAQPTAKRSSLVHTGDHRTGATGWCHA